MPDVKYQVVVEYVTTGKLLSPAATGDLATLASSIDRTRAGSTRLKDELGSASKGAEDLGRALFDAGEGAGRAFMGAVEHVATLSMHLATLAGGAVLGAAAYGVGHLNNELEQTNLSLAAIFQAEGFSKTFTGATKIAADQMAKMKQDVKTLPGDLGQLSDAMKTIAPDAANAGAAPDRIRKLAGSGMLVGQIVGIKDQAQTARELAMLLEGRAGAHDILGLRLGFSGDRAKSFNKEDAGKRLADVEAAFARFAPAADAFGQSFVAYFTTLKDNVKYSLLAPATSPLFDSVKHTIGGINDWFDHNPAKVAMFADDLGQRLAGAWQTGEIVVREWGPAVARFAHDAYMDIAGIWTRVGPAVERIGLLIRTSLGDGSALKHLESVLVLYRDMKIGSMAASIASPMGGILKAGIGAFGAGGGGEGGMLGMLGGAGGVAAGAGTAIIGAAIAGEMIGLSNGNKQATEAALDLSRSFAKLTDDLTDGQTGVSRFLTMLGSEATSELSKFLQGLDGIINFSRTRKEISDSIDDVGARADEDIIAHPERYAGSEVQNAIDRRSVRKYKASLASDVFSPNRDESSVDMSRGGSLAALGLSSDKLADAVAKQDHSVHVGRVEITVSGNHDPSRIAREVAAHLAEMKRHPTVSRAVRNYSGTTTG